MSGIAWTPRRRAWRRAFEGKPLALWLLGLVCSVDSRAGIQNSLLSVQHRGWVAFAVIGCLHSTRAFCGDT